MELIFILLSKLPNFKGKLFFLEKFYQHFKTKIKTEQLSSTIHQHFLSLNLNDRIQRRMFIKKCHEPETEFPMVDFIKKSKCFLDIGANIGYFSILAAGLNKEIRVFSFEPNPNNIKRIKKNAELNRLTNITISEICLSDFLGEVTFAVPPENESGWGRIENDHLPLSNFTKIKAEVTSLDELMRSGFFKNLIPDLIKIDIEGNEYKVIKGGYNFLKKYKPVLCVELNEPCLIDCNTSGKEVMDSIIQLGYKAFYIKNNTLKETLLPIENYRYLNYFFISF